MLTGDFIRKQRQIIQLFLAVVRDSEPKRAAGVAL